MNKKTKAYLGKREARVLTARNISETPYNLGDLAFADEPGVNKALMDGWTDAIQGKSWEDLAPAFNDMLSNVNQRVATTGYVKASQISMNRLAKDSSVTIVQKWIRKFKEDT